MTEPTIEKLQAELREEMKTLRDTMETTDAPPRDHLLERVLDLRAAFHDVSVGTTGIPNSAYTLSELRTSEKIRAAYRRGREKNLNTRLTDISSLELRAVTTLLRNQFSAAGIAYAPIIKMTIGNQPDDISYTHSLEKDLAGLNTGIKAVLWIERMHLKVKEQLFSHLFKLLSPDTHS